MNANKAPRWRSIAYGCPPLDAENTRIIAVTADHDFDGAQMHDIHACDFYAQDENGEVVGTEITQCCTHWIYRNELFKGL